MPKEAIDKPSSRYRRELRQLIKLQASTEGCLHGHLPSRKPLLLWKASAPPTMDSMPEKQFCPFTVWNHQAFNFTELPHMPGRCSHLPIR